jgi:acetyl esterase/lipase
VQYDIQYGYDPVQTLDYYPAPSTNSPIIIIVHGGGWSRGDKLGTSYVNAANLFNAEGYAVVCINYRLTPAVTYPSHINDLSCAIAWVKSNASLFNGDSSHVVLYGHSAGGQMASFIGQEPDYGLGLKCCNNVSMKLDAVMLTSATLDFNLTNPNTWGFINDMLGDSISYWKIAQPVNHAFNNFDTRFLILCGEKDDLGIVQDFNFYDSLQYYGHCAMFKKFAAYDHESMIDNLTKSDTVFKTMVDFLDSLFMFNSTSCPYNTTVVATIQQPNDIIIYFNGLDIHLPQNVKLNELSLIFYDTYGRMVMKKGSIGHNNIQIDYSSLSKGMYLYAFTDGFNNLYCEKFVIE